MDYRTAPVTGMLVPVVLMASRNGVADDETLAAINRLPANSRVTPEMLQPGRLRRAQEAVERFRTQSQDKVDDGNACEFFLGGKPLQILRRAMQPATDRKDISRHMTSTERSWAPAMRPPTDPAELKAYDDEWERLRSASMQLSEEDLESLRTPAKDEDRWETWQGMVVLLEPRPVFYCVMSAVAGETDGDDAGSAVVDYTTDVPPPPDWLAGIAAAGRLQAGGQPPTEENR
jgi:hypothetical protein